MFYKKFYKYFFFNFYFNSLKVLSQKHLQTYSTNKTNLQSNKEKKQKCVWKFIPALLTTFISIGKKERNENWKKIKVKVFNILHQKRIRKKNER